MSDTVTIPVITYNNIERTMNRVLARLNNDRIKATITEAEAAEFCKVTVKRFRELIEDGTVPANAYVTTVNNNKRFFKEKLIK